MKIAFDALPLLGRMTGIGHCEAGQIQALTAMHPEYQFTLNYFAVRHLQECAQSLKPYLRQNVTAKHCFCSAYGYRAVSTLIPVPYSLFFGKDNDLTHFSIILSRHTFTEKLSSLFMTWYTRHFRKRSEGAPNKCLTGA